MNNVYLQCPLQWDWMAQSTPLRLTCWASPLHLSPVLGLLLRWDRGVILAQPLVSFFSLPVWFWTVNCKKDLPLLSLQLLHYMLLLCLLMDIGFLNLQHHSHCGQYRCSRDSTGWTGHHGDSANVRRLANWWHHSHHCSGLGIVSSMCVRTNNLTAKSHEPLSSS